MPTKTISPVTMPQMWQEMVLLAQNQPTDTLPASLDWQVLRTLTLKNNLTALVNDRAQQALPREYRNHPAMIELRLLSKMNRMQSRMRIQALVQLARVFQERSIPMLSFKGPLLSLELYGDPEVRNSCDLDILVSEADLERARACLLELGYEQQLSVWDATPKRQKIRRKRGKQMHLLFRKDGVAVELHWRICYRFAVSFETLWLSRRCVSLLGQPVYTLGSQENLCYLVTHGAGHGFRQLRWLLEILTLMEREDFFLSPLYTQMKRRGVANLLLETLLLLYRLPGFAMPERLCILEDHITFEKVGTHTTISWEYGAAKDVRRAQALAAAAIPLLRRTNPEEGLDGRRYQHLLPSLGSRPPFLLSLFLPDTPELEWLDLPDNWFFLYYLLRPISFFHGRRKKKHPSTPSATKNGDERQ